MKLKRNISNTLIYIFLVIIGFFVFLPLLYTFLSSFKTNMELMAHPERLIPEEFTLDNYITAFTSPDFNVPRMLLNSIVYSSICTFATLMTTSMAGYVFARGEFPGKKAIFGIICALMFIILGSISVYPMFNVTNLLGLSNSLWGLIVVKIFGISTSNIILIKSYVESLPRALDEAAEIDGCNFVRTFFSVILPLLKPIMATVGILAFNSTWNDYLMPSIFTMNNPEQRTLIVGVVALKNNDQGAASWSLMLAGTVVALLPVLVMYGVGNRFFISGLAAGAVKE